MSGDRRWLDLPLLGVDPGTRRVGVAFAGLLGIVRPLGFLDAEPRAGLLQKLRAVALDRQCAGIIVGLPLNMDGTEGRPAKRARELGAAIAEATGLPVDFCDEGLSTFEADRRLRGLGYSLHEQKARIDAAAAAVMLTSYLGEREAAQREAARRAAMPPAEPGETGDEPPNAETGETPGEE